MKTALLTIVALLAFAGNSILCRIALGEGTIDPASFTSVRLASGIAVLAAVMKLWGNNKAVPSTGSWQSAMMLFIYAATFSYAYVSLETGVGALILFCAVQITIIFRGLFTGERPSHIEWLGLLVALAGFVYLVMPGASAPSIGGFVLMSLSGIAWGFYTLAGRASVNPLQDTSFNFLRTTPFILLLVVVTLGQADMTSTGFALAALSGGLTSGVGYAIWYAALGGLSGTQAAVVQLFVPVIAAAGGVVFANEVLSLRLGISSLLICGGILAVILGKLHADKNVRTAAERASV